MQMPQIMMESQYTLHDFEPTLLTKRCSKALFYAGISSHPAIHLQTPIAISEDETVNTYRTLARHQDDISASELMYSTFAYEGSPEGLDILLAHSSWRFEHFDIIDTVNDLPPLALVLMYYGWEFFRENGSRFNSNSCILQAAYPKKRKQWEPLI